MAVTIKMKLFGRELDTFADVVLIHMMGAVKERPDSVFVFNPKAGEISALTVEETPYARRLEVPTEDSRKISSFVREEHDRRTLGRRTIADLLKKIGEQPNEERIEEIWQTHETDRRSIKPREVPIRGGLHVERSA